MRPLNLFLLFFIFLWLLSPGERPTGDAAIMAYISKMIVTEKSITFPYHSKGYTVVGADGKAYPKFPLPWMVVNVPQAYVLSVIENSSLPMDQKELTSRLIRGFTPAVTGALAGVLLYLTLLMAGTSNKASLFITIIFLFSSCTLPYLRSQYSEVLQVFSVNLGLFTFSKLNKETSFKNMFLVGISLGFMVFVKLVLIFFSAIFGLCSIILIINSEKPIRMFLYLLAGFTIPIFFLFTYNILRFSDPLIFDYGYYPIPVDFSNPLLFGLYGLLFSSGRGLLWFSPPTLLSFLGIRGVFQSRNMVCIASLFGFLSILLAYSCFSVWHGAEQWGPRFLVPMHGPLAILSSHLFIKPFNCWVKKIGVCLGLCGFFINILGVLISYNTFFDALPYNPYSSLRVDANGNPLMFVERDNLHLSNFEPYFSPIIGHFWLLKHAILGGDLKQDCPWKDQVEDPVRTENLEPTINLWLIPQDNWSKVTIIMGLSIATVLFFSLVALVLQRNWYESC